jgi:hypothetical protein
VGGLLAVAFVPRSECVDQLALVHKLPFRERAASSRCSTTVRTLGKSCHSDNDYTRFSLV